MTNLDRYHKDLTALLTLGSRLEMSIQAECFPIEFEAQVKRQIGVKKTKDLVAKLPSFRGEYERWYSEAKTVVKQLLPDRLADFVRHYEKPKPRKDITYENYRIEDFLQGLSVTRGWDKEKVVGPDAAIPHFRQQVAILKAVEARFESSLFDIKQLVQADLFDSELEAARELAGHKFVRAAGAIAGVILEKHLAQVCANHHIAVAKKGPGISHLNDLLRKSDVIDVPQWRFIQHLGDIRNLCDHSKASDPTDVQVQDLIAGVEKTIKTLF